MAEFDPVMRPGDAAEFKQFFRDDEYGEYLQRFVDRFELSSHLRLGHQVLKISRVQDSGQWKVSFATGDSVARSEMFDAIMICTGLVGRPGEIQIDQTRSSTRVLADIRRIDEEVHGQTVVVCGGGESASIPAIDLQRGIEVIACTFRCEAVFASVPVIIRFVACLRTICATV